MQELVVALIVACAAGFLAVRYVPKTVLSVAGNVLVRKARDAGWMGLASRLEKGLASANCASSCGSCGGCKEPGQSRDSITAEELRHTARRR